MLRYFNFEPCFKLWWCFARDLFGSQIPYGLMALFHMALGPSGLGSYFTCKRFAVQTHLWSLEFVIQINLKHDTIKVNVNFNFNQRNSWCINYNQHIQNKIKNKLRKLCIQIMYASDWKKLQLEKLKRIKTIFSTL